MSKDQALIADKAELNKAIDTWGKQGQKWVKQGHILAMSALTILGTTGDIGPVNRLYLAMPKGTKSSAMAEWLLSFGKLVPTEGEEAKSKPFSYSKDKAMNLEGAAQKPWFEFKPEPTVVEVFDVQAQVRAFLKRLESGAAKAQTAIGTDLIKQIKGLLPEGDEPATTQADPLANAEPAPV